MRKQKSEKSTPNARAKGIGDADPAYKHEKKEPFLAEFRTRRAIGIAAEAVNISQRTVKRWRESDPEFRQKFEEIDLNITDELKASTLERAIMGVPQPGPNGSVRREFSDTLAVLHLKQRDPSFRDRVQVEIVQKEISKAIADIVEIIRRELPPALADRIAKQMKRTIEMEVAA
jgi:hypothetical protein